MKSHNVFRLALTIFSALVSVGAFGEGLVEYVPVTGTATQLAPPTSATPSQERWLRATIEQRRDIAEEIGEQGAERWAAKQGLDPILSHAKKQYLHGPDQVYRAPNGDVVVVESKGGTSPVNRGYGYIQGTPEHAVESAKRILKSPRATQAEKEAALEILEAAKNGKLRTVVVRTPHTLGECRSPFVEYEYGTTAQAKQMAQEALEELAKIVNEVRAGLNGGATGSRVGLGKTVEKSGKTATLTTEEGMAPVAKTARTLFKGGESLVAQELPTLGRLATNSIGKSLVVVGVGVEADHRYEQARSIERLYEGGAITADQRLTGHAKNAGGFLGGWTGAALGAKGGVAIGISCGAVGGPFGVACGALFGGIIGGAAGYVSGEKAGEYIAESAMIELLPAT